MNEVQKRIIKNIVDDLIRRGKNPHGALREMLIEIESEEERKKGEEENGKNATC